MKNSFEIKYNLNKSKNNKISFFSFVLIVCLLQISVSAILNISKCIINYNRLKKMDEFKTNVAIKNHQLKNEFLNFNSLNSLEAIARNNLKMAGEDEVLVIISNTKASQGNESKNSKNKKIIKKS